MENRNIQNIHKLAPMQLGMLYHAILEKNSFAYNQQLSCRISGNIDIDYLKASLEELFYRHDVLRSVFFYETAKEPILVILKKIEIDFTFIDISNTRDIIDSIEKYKYQEKIKGFDLTKDRLLRISLLKLNENEYELIWSFHHIIMDGWSMSILVSEFFKIYNSFLAKIKFELPPVKQYIEFIRWLEKKNVEEMRQYWNGYLENYNILTSVPRVENKLKTQGYLHETFFCSLGPERTEKINGILKKNGATLNSLMLTLWGILLAKLNNSTEVLFGNVVSGRSPEIDDVENIVGLFINTIPVRISINVNSSIIEIMGVVQRYLIESGPNYYLPLSEIQNESELKQNLLDHLIILENYPVSDQISKLTDGYAIPESKKLRVTKSEVFEQTNYNLNVIIFPGDDLRIQYTYNANQYNSSDIERTNGFLLRLINQAINADNALVSELELLNEEEKYQLLHSFNNTHIAYDDNKAIHELFEKQAESRPNSIALETNDCLVTYSELNKRSNQLAKLLIKKGIVPNVIVGLMTNRSVEMIIAILGILKSGGAYLPIDLYTPEERLRRILEDSSVSLVLSDKGLKFNFPGIEVIDITDSKIYLSNDSNPKIRIDPRNLAYVIYTSGSTGEPKGVLVKHKSVINYISWAIKTYGGNNMPLYTNISFDLTVTSIFLPLLSGNRIIIHKEHDVKEIFEKILKNERVQLIKLTPSHLKILDEIWSDKEKCHLKGFILGGEVLESSLAKRIVVKSGYTAEIYNEYGPTEATVGCMIYKYDIDKDTDISVPIGYPINNTQVYIMGLDMHLQPVGIQGELCIAGDGLARGYHNKDLLTLEKFFPNPFNNNSKLYKTGDLAKLLPDGKIEFLGRIDDQVKIRGFRIELSEIEKQLNEYSEIKESTVVARKWENGDKYLCAYYVADKELESSSLKDFLRKILPDYMVPSYFVRLFEMPLTRNGKLNFNALPAPDLFISKEIIRPKNEIEKKLLFLWSELLNKNQSEISIDSNFFDLGGHSLKAMIALSRIHKEFEVKISLHQFLENPTPKRLSEIIVLSGYNTFKSIKATEKKEYYEQSFYQRGLFIIHQMDKTDPSYNISVTLEISDNFNVSMLEKALLILISRHESLRTSFHIISEKPVQIVHDDLKISVDVIEGVKDEEFLQLTKQLLSKPFDLSSAPVFRVHLIVLHSGAKKLLFELHHISVDNVSMEILKKDFESIISNEVLPPIKLNYRDYAFWQNRIIKSGIINQEYWTNELTGGSAKINIVNGNSASANSIKDIDLIIFNLSPNVTVSLRNIAKSYKTTLFNLLLTSWKIIFSKLSNQDDLIIGVPIDGRNHVDLEKVVGLFVNTLPIRTIQNSNMNFYEFLTEVSNKVDKAIENRTTPLELLIKSTDSFRKNDNYSIFCVVFDYLLMEGTNNNYNEALSFYNKGSSQFDITIYAYEHIDSVNFKVNFKPGSYSVELIEDVIDYFNNLINSIIENPLIKLSDLRLIREIDKEEMTFINPITSL